MFPFLIDAGSSATTLHPQDALELLGDDYFQIDFANDPHRVSARGVGGVVNRVVRHATLGITSIDREPYFLRMRILIAEPTQSAPRGHGNWQLPSVLGRDFLRHFPARAGLWRGPQGGPGNALSGLLSLEAIEVMAEFGLHRLGGVRGSSRVRGRS